MNCTHGNPSDTCDTCYATDLAKYGKPRRTLTVDLAELEASDPDVAAAAAELRAAKAAIGRKPDR